MTPGLDVLLDDHRVVAERRLRLASGGSQRVWGDYNWFHKMVRGGAIGDVTEAWVNVGGPSGPCYLPPVETPEDVDWEMWLGPAPWRPFHPTLITGGFRPPTDPRIERPFRTPEEFSQLVVSKGLTGDVVRLGDRLPHGRQVRRGRQCQTGAG